MNTHELPMILFTVLSQMSVGAFVALGAVQVLAMGRYPSRVIDRLADPALLAIGPTLVIGLLASMLHMNDLTNTFNVIRNITTSWLSREIIFGVAFAALGFAFFIAQWRKIGSPALRQALAALTALVGLGLVWCQSMIYYSLTTVPAWHHWGTPLRFFATTIILGSLAVAVAMAISLARTPRTPRTHTTRDTDGNTGASTTTGGSTAIQNTTTAAATPARGGLATLTRPAPLTTEDAPKADRLLRSSLRTISAVTMLTALILIIALPLYLADLAADPTTASTTSAGIMAGTFFTTRLILLVIGAVILAFAIFRLTATNTTTHTLTLLITTALAVCFLSEIMGRSLFYDTMTRIGM